ncbi:hypothetical protein QQP08_022620, partial [Theobroma cacao]
IGRGKPLAYCQVCGLSAKYCEFRFEFDKCKPWLFQNTPDLYLDLFQAADAKEANKVVDQLQSIGIFPATAVYRSELNG